MSTLVAEATSPGTPRSPQYQSETNVAEMIQAEHDVDEADIATADDDGDSIYGSEASSCYSASVTSSIRNNIHENGLRYHAFKQDAYYPFPNDENEQNRDDIKHAMTVMLCGGKLHFAPIGDNPQAILDLGTRGSNSAEARLTTSTGTGTGIWAIESQPVFPLPLKFSNTNFGKWPTSTPALRWKDLT